MERKWSDIENKDQVIELSLARIDIAKGDFTKADLSPDFYLLIKKKRIIKRRDGTFTLKLEFHQ